MVKDKKDIFKEIKKIYNIDYENENEMLIKKLTETYLDSYSEKDETFSPISYRGKEYNIKNVFSLIETFHNEICVKTTYTIDELEKLGKVIENILILEVKKTLSDASFCFFDKKMPIGTFLVTDIRKTEIAKIVVDKDDFQIFINELNYKKRMN